MALSITELDRESAEYLPAREVMTSFGRRADGHDVHGGHDGHTVDGNDCNVYRGGILNGLNVQDVLTELNVEEVQVGLVNVLLEDFQGTLDLGSHNSDDDTIVED